MGEVKRFAQGKNEELVIVELDTAEEAVLPVSELVDGRDSLVLPTSKSDGTHINVRVIDAYTDSSSSRNRCILVSQRAVEERVFDQYVDRAKPEAAVDVVVNTIVPEEVLEEARRKAAKNQIIRGVVKGSTAEGTRVDIGGYVAVLLDQDSRVKSRRSLRPGIIVKVRFKDISSRGITLTREGVA